MEQHRQVKHGTEARLPRLVVSQIQQSSPVRIQHMQAVHLCCMGQHGFEDAELLEDAHARRLEQETRSDRLALVRPLEQDDLMSLPLQQYRRSRSRSSAAEDRDTAWRGVHRCDFQQITRARNFRCA